MKSNSKDKRMFLPLFTTIVGKDGDGDVVDEVGFRNRRKRRII